MDVDRTPTHNTHLCSTVCSQARSAHHALGSREQPKHDLHFIFVRLKRICHLVLHVSHPWLPHLPYTTSTSSSSFTLPSTTQEHAAPLVPQEQLREHSVQASGHQGGTGAVPCSFACIRTTFSEEKEEPDAIAGKEMLAPSRSVLNEIWVAPLQLPNRRQKKDNAFGAGTQKLCAPAFMDLLTRALAHTIASRHQSLHSLAGGQTLRSQAGNSASSTEFAHSGRKCARYGPRSGITNSNLCTGSMHGFFRHNGREQAILVCEMAGDEARKGSAQSVRCFSPHIRSLSPPRLLTRKPLHTCAARGPPVQRPVRAAAAQCLHRRPGG